MKLNVLFIILAITFVFNIDIILSLLIELQITCDPFCEGTYEQYNTTIGCTATHDFCNRLPLYNYIHAFQEDVSIQLFEDSDCQTPASLAYNLELNECVVVGPMHYQLLYLPGGN